MRAQSTSTSFFSGEWYVHSDSQSVPQTTALLDNYPNPFNPSTTIRYALSANGYVSLKVYDIQGQMVVDIQGMEKGVVMKSVRVAWKEKGVVTMHEQNK